MGLRLFFLPNFPGAMFIQGGTFIPDSRVCTLTSKVPWFSSASLQFSYFLLEGKKKKIWLKQGLMAQASSHYWYST